MSAVPEPGGAGRPAAAAAAQAVNWLDELRGALNATAATLPFVLSFGFIVFGAVGSSGAGVAQIGLTAALVSVVLGGLVFIAVSRVQLPCASPSATSSLILGAAVVQWPQDPALHPAQAGGAAMLVATTGATVALAGVLYLVLGACRAGSLVRFVPQPVLAGFMNGVAILIVLSQLAPLLGLAPDALARHGLPALAGWQAPVLAVAVTTALLMLGLARVAPRAPVAVLALVLAAALSALLHGALGHRFDPPLIGPLQATLPWPDALAPLAGPEGAALLARHGRAVLITAALLALLGALESTLNLAAVDQQLSRRSDPNRVLLSLGVANIACGLFGGLPLIYLRLRAIATLSGGGRSWRSPLAGSLLLAALFTLGLPGLERLPTAAVAGVVVMLAWSLVDPWTGRLVQQCWRGDRSTELLLSLGTVAAVFATTALLGFAAGVALGVLMSMVIFIRALHRSLVRLRYRAAEIPSRRVYPPQLEARLRALRPQIEVIELEGALFFGNVERLLQEAERAAADTRFLVLDLRRVSSLDASGAVALGALHQRLLRRGITLLLAGVTPDNRHGLALQAQGVLGSAGSPALWPDADRAVEHAETQLLLAAGLSLQAMTVPLAQCALFQGLDADACRRLASHLQPRALAAGERLFAQGDVGDALYVLTEGSVSVLARERGQRFVSFSPGMSFGETAVLDGGGRTADAVADRPSTVHALPAAAMAALQRDDPALAAQVYRNLAQHLSERLRGAAAAWRHAAG
jgi:SulP family sulfate permease